MTSLDYILDTSMDDEDDPQIDKNDDGSISTGPSHPSRAATSSHDKRDKDDRLTPAPTRRRGPSGRSSKSTATATSPSASSSRPALVSRRSTASSEPMDPSGYGSYAQGSSSGGGIPPSNMPTRPMGTSPGEGSVPVKLTPITGRVSRAKKGVPVHTCDICKPPKTFTRAEHLRRHQLSHQTPKFPCTFPGCDKAFHRADLLARHSQRHEQDDRASRGMTGDVSRPPSAASEGPSGLSYTSSMGGASGTSYPGGMLPYAPMGSSGSGSGQPPMSPPQHHGRGENHPSSSNAPSPGYGYPLSSELSPSLGGSPFAMEFQEPRTSPFSPLYMPTTGDLSHGLPSLTIPNNSIPDLIPAGHDGSPWPSSASESTYSAPSEIGHGRRNITHGHESPISDWPVYPGPSLQSPSTGFESMTSGPFFPPFSPTSSSLDPVNMQPMFADEPAFVDQQYYTYSSVRSPTPTTISLSAQSAENLVTLAAPAPIPGAASTGSRQKGPTVLLGVQGTSLLTANSLSPQVRSAIPKYLNLYWDRFDALLPLVHRRSVKPAAGEVLCCAMAAIGTQYLQGREDRIRGNELHEFAWREIKTCTQWNLPIMQAILLCELYARFRGRSAARAPSEQFQSLYSRMADQQMPDNDFTFSTSTRHDRWNEWIDNESRRRLLACCFILDVHTSVYYQQPVLRSFHMSTPPIPLIGPTRDLWAPQSSEPWEALFKKTTPDPESLIFSGETPTSEQLATAPYLDIVVFLVSEALRLPKRASPAILDVSAEINPNSAERISELFPGSAVGNTYLALHYTPLHDLLAVSGETWLFSKKIQSPEVFQQHKKRLQQWCGTPYAGAAVGFAAKSLLAYFEHTNHNTKSNSPSDSEEDDGHRDWNMLDLADWWAIYVCALICWALGHRAMRSTTTHNQQSNSNASEKETLKWLKMVADLSAEDALTLRYWKESLGVAAMVRKRLEDEAVGNRSRLLVDATRTLRKLEERANPKLF
ncbi:hypothetical protein M426DRAFT_93805 [Hypoxylon sp. CI-4A]|nr:hypothetical protein M426DRAFT_93805 [Hypoxylon sp. CI-4A]